MGTNFKVFRNRSLVIVGLSESVSNIGNWITMMAVFAMIVFKGDGSVGESSGIFLAGLVPTLLFSPVAGWLVDRLDRKWLMIASELISGAIIAGLVFPVPLGLIYGLLALQAISIAIMTPARQAVVPDIVTEQELTQANAFLQQLNGVIKIFAPMLAGLVLAVLSPHQAILLDVASFGMSALILLQLPALPPHPVEVSPAPKAEAQPKPAAKSTLLAFLRESAQLRLLFSAAFFAILLLIGYDVLSPIYTRDILHGDESLLGLQIGLIGAGTLAAAAYLMLRKKQADPWSDLTVGMALLVAIPFSLLTAPYLNHSGVERLWVLAGNLIGGVGNGVLSIQAGTLLQTLSPRALLGRMGGVFQSVMVAGQLVGILLTPLLVPAVLTMSAYFGAATICLVLLLVYVIFLGKVQKPSSVSLPDET